MHMLIAGAVTLGLIAFGVSYVLLVLTAYTQEGPHYRLHLELSDPVRSADRLLVWMGVKMIRAIGRAARSILDALYDASADVGTWVVSKSSDQVQARVRSRFL